MIRYNTFHYNVNEGMLQSSVKDIVFDENNFGWLSYTNGLQKFDGEEFISISPQEGLPEVSDLDLYKTKSGSLLFSYRQGISKYDIHQNIFVTVFTDEKANLFPRKFLGESNNIIYFISSDGIIKGLDNKTFKLVQSFDSRLSFKESSDYLNLSTSRNIYNGKTAIYYNQHFYLIDLYRDELIKESESHKALTGTFVYLLNDHEIMFYSGKEKPEIISYNFNSEEYKLVNSIANKSSKAFRSVIYNWQGTMLISNFNEVYITDSTLRNLDHRLVDYQNQPLTGNAVIKDIKEDNYGNIYLLTLSNGFVKVIANNFPIRYFGASGAENNFVISLLADKKNNRVIAGTNGDGILVFDTLQKLVKHIKFPDNSNKSFSPSAIIKHDNAYYLFIFPEKKIWVLDKNLNWRTPIPIEKMRPANGNVDYYSTVLFQDEAHAIVQSGSSFFKIDFIRRTAKQYLFSKDIILSATYYRGNIITHANDVLYFIDTTNFKSIREFTLNNTGGVRCYAQNQEGNIFIGANRGIFEIDASGKLLQHFTKETGLPDDCIYAMAFDKSGNLWCSSNKGIFRIGPNNRIFQLKKEDGLQENEFNTNVVQVTEDWELYFGGVNGISSFYPADINNFNDQINLLFTNIRINNEKLDADFPPWNINSLRLPHDKNYMSFDFIAMANSNPSQYIYQYKMEPIDKEWIQSNVSQTIRYQLPPGKFTFKIYAGRAFNKNAKALKEISIFIKPPYWQTWWFYSVIAVLTLFILVIGMHRYNHSKYLKKLSILENETRLRKERERISRDLHDNIGAYANAVLYNTELLEKEEGTAEQASIMKELRFASKDIITSLRETIWALKKENFTAEECLFRIKNFLQPIARYYPKINFKISGFASAEKKLPYKSALNIVRVTQEAISNAIKHADSNTIRLTSEQNGEEWKIIIEDDGCGFCVEDEKDADGNGLKNMTDRAKEGDFNLKIISVPGKGTTITILIS